MSTYSEIARHHGRSRDFDRSTDCLAHELRTEIQNNPLLRHGKLKVCFYHNGYGAALYWGPRLLATADYVRIYGVPDSMGRVTTYGAGALVFPRALVEDVISRIMNGEIQDTYVVYLNGNLWGDFPTMEEAREKKDNLLARFGGAWAIYKNGVRVEMSEGNA